MPYKYSEDKKIYDKEYRKHHRKIANEYYRKWYAKNKENVLERNRKWRKDKNYKSRANTKSYRLMIINLLRQRDGDICGHCHEIIPGKDFGVDHLVPICIGGNDDANNLRLVHKICNIRRERNTYEK